MAYNIEDYRFGKMVVNGKTYTDDLIIFPDHIDASWWREKGHKLKVKDLTSVLEAHPDKLIIGRGANGVMKVKDKVIQELREKGIQVTAEKTGKAVTVFNEESRKAEESGATVVGAFHLTC